MGKITILLISLFSGLLNSNCGKPLPHADGHYLRDHVLMSLLLNNGQKDGVVTNFNMGALRNGSLKRGPFVFDVSLIYQIDRTD